MKNINFFIILLILLLLVISSKEKFINSSNITMNIGYALDKNYIDILINCIHSLLINNRKYKINFFIITDTICNLRCIKNKINSKFGNKYPFTYKIIEKEDSIFFKKYHRNKEEERKDINIIHYSQVLFGKYFNIDRLLYLEADQLVLKDIYEFYNTNIDNKLLAASAIKNIDNFKEINDNKIINYKNYKYTNNIYYFNAGVTLINFKYWRQNNILKKFKDIIIENYYSKEPLYKFYTQGILNILCYNNNYKIVDIKYNLSRGYIDRYINSKYFNTNKVHYLIDNSSILHFNGRVIYTKKINNIYKKKILDIYKKYDLTNVL